MESTDPAAYGEAFADVYDDWYGDISDTAAAVAVLTGLAGDGRLLELGVGTGRIALPLADAGIEVHGIDASPAMLERLRAKPGGAAVVTHLADMADLDVAGRFRVVFVAFNTLFNLTTHRAQQQCLTRVAELLDSTGTFVVEAFVPASTEDPTVAGDHEETRPRGPDQVRSLSRHDPIRQTVSGVHVQTTPGGQVIERPWAILYRTPSQLDAMCHDVGLELSHRWADWDGTPFTDESARHISVYSPLG